MNALGVDIGGSAMKFAMLEGEQMVWSAASQRYHRPDAAELRRVLAAALSGVPTRPGPLAIGVCAPGLYDAGSGAITRSVNMPALVGIPLEGLIREALPAPCRGSSTLTCITSDAHAAGHDFARVHRVRQRLLAISLGTGVGAIVLDDGVPLRVSGASSGHFGQLDVSVTGIDPVPVGPDGGRGSLEGYIGAPALRARHGDPLRWLESLRGDEPELQALARAIRIGHAIYRPHVVALLGGLGIRLGHQLSAIDRLVRDGLTSLAVADWRIAVGDSDHHAARGAADLARATSATTVGLRS